MKFRERLQYFLGVIPLVMLASLVASFALSGFSPKPVAGAGGFPDPYWLSLNPVPAAGLLRVAGSGSRVIAGPGDIGADGDRRPEPDIAALFGIEPSPWSGRYVRAGEGAGSGLSPAMKAALSLRGPEREGLPCLAFLGPGGRAVILEPTADFDGKTPLFRLNGTKALLNGPFAVNVPAAGHGTGETAREIGTIDLGLTDEGKAKLRAAGIPDRIPAAIERITPRTNTLLLNADIAGFPAGTGAALDPVNEWYRSRFALYFPGSLEEAYWRAYAPLVRSETEGAKTRLTAAGAPAERGDSARGAAPGYRFRVDSRRMWRESEGTGWVPFTVKGVNLGSSLPGRGFTEFSRDEALYWHWFALMRDMNLNSIRVYTLFPPEFYRALAAFNRANPGRELCLLQEIWPEEAPPGHNLLDAVYTAAFHREIEYAITAIHGAGSVPERQGRASGYYDTDVSPWTAAFLVGREIEPDEVLMTNTRNEGYSYAGRWLSATGGSPTESWLAAACDKAASYEISRWGEGRPVSVINWPPLDPVPHWVEWRAPWLAGKSPENDKAEVNVDRIDVSPDFLPGFFCSWHIYPNYPDFMVSTPWYSKYRDGGGEFRYGGYLRELRMFNGRYPALLAEFGLSTSLGTAHVAPDGLDHGGVAEETQGPGLIRMAKAALAEGFMGTVIFEWADEWAKQTWTTAPFMIPFGGHQAWHNALDPEQYYGIVAMDARVAGETVAPAVDSGAAAVSRLGVGGDAECLEIAIGRDGGWGGVSGTLSIGFDVFDPGAGLRVLDANAPESARGLEFLLEIRLPVPEDGNIAARLLAADTCNVGKNRFAISGATPRAFEEVRILVNRETVDSLGRLSDPVETDRSAILAGIRGVSTGGNVLSARIPWAMLNVADPSRALVLDDPGTYEAWPGTDALKVSESRGITLIGAFEGSIGGLPTTDWFPRQDGGFADTWYHEFAKWERPRWVARQKPAVGNLSAFFGTY